MGHLLDQGLTVWRISEIRPVAISSSYDVEVRIS